MITLLPHNRQDIKPGHRIAFVGDVSQKEKAIKDCSQHLSSFNDRITLCMTIDGVANLHAFEPYYRHQHKMFSCYKQNKETKVKASHLVVLFTNISQELLKDQLLREIWFNGRHSGISVLVDVDPSDCYVDPTLRTQIDWAFVWNSDSRKINNRNHEQWVGYFPSFEEYRDHLPDDETKCLVVRSSYGAFTIRDNVFNYPPSQKRVREIEVGDSDSEEEEDAQRKCKRCCCHK